MPRPRVPMRRFLTVTATLAAPMALALALIATLDRPGVGAILLIGLGAALLLGLVVRTHLGDLAAVRAYAGSLARAGAEKPPRLGITARLTDLDPMLRQLHRARTAMDEGRERLFQANETIFESLPDALLLLDDTMVVVRANRAARTLLERDPAGRDLVAVLRAPALLSAVQTALAGGESEAVELQLSGAVERIVRAQVDTLGADGDGAVILALHDVTELKRGEQMRVDFVANASHELRTPLASLSGFIETLRADPACPPEDRARFLAIMSDQANRMARLVDDLLSLSRIELREHTPPTEAVVIDALLAEVVDALQPLAGERGVEIEIASTVTAPSVIGDEYELAQVFRNLVDNAIKYGRDGGVVRIELCHHPDRAATVAGEPSGGMISIGVSDQGDGIAAEHLARLTERFYRVDAARSRALGGTGLGLAIVKHIVNRHRGTLAIESEPGEGSRFTVHLPAASEG